MRKLVESGGELKEEGRNLLSVAYKNVVGARRSAWRVVSSLEAKESKEDDNAKLEIVRKYRETIENELSTICTEVIVSSSLLFCLIKTHSSFFLFRNC